MANIRIDELPVTVNPSLQHAFPAMKDGLTVQLTLSQVKSLIVDGAPDLLDTLDEISAAIGDDENFATTMTNLILQRLNLSGGTMTGPINLGGHNLVNGYSPGSLIQTPLVITSSDSAISLHAKTRIIKITLQAGGAGGSGANSTSSANASAGAGGSAGETVISYIDVSSLNPKQISVAIGSGGNGVSGGDGGDGGNTVYSDGVNTITANGGNGPIVASSNQSAVPRESLSGGNGGNGLINIPGGAGTGGLHWGDIPSPPYQLGFAGKGGDSMFGAGGLAQSRNGTSSAGDDGHDALGYGAGGGGAVSLHGNGARPGGNGSGGIAVIEEYA